MEGGERSPRGRRAPARGGEREADLPGVAGDGPVYTDIDPDDKDALIDRLVLENAILGGAREVLVGRAIGRSTNRE